MRTHKRLGGPSGVMVMIIGVMLCGWHWHSVCATECCNRSHGQSQHGEWNACRHGDGYWGDVVWLTLALLLCHWMLQPISWTISSRWADRLSSWWWLLGWCCVADIGSSLYDRKLSPTSWTIWASWADVMFVERGGLAVHQYSSRSKMWRCRVFVFEGAGCLGFCVCVI